MFKYLHSEIKKAPAEYEDFLKLICHSEGKARRISREASLSFSMTISYSLEATINVVSANLVE